MTNENNVSSSTLLDVECPQVVHVIWLFRCHPLPNSLLMSKNWNELPSITTDWIFHNRQRGRVSFSKRRLSNITVWTGPKSLLLWTKSSYIPCIRRAKIWPSNINHCIFHYLVIWTESSYIPSSPRAKIWPSNINHCIFHYLFCDKIILYTFKPSS